MKRNRAERREWVRILPKIITSIDMTLILDNATTEDQRFGLVAMLVKWYKRIEARRKAPDKELAANVLVATDDAVSHQMRHDPIAPRVVCRKGCSQCCYVPTHILRGEAELLVEYAAEHGIEIDLERLVKQRAAYEHPVTLDEPGKRMQVLDETYERWATLPHAERACVFLSDAGECRAYDVRPAVCRKYLVLDDPAGCDTVKFHGKEVSRMGVPEAEAILSAAMTFKRHGTMPAMLLEVLDEKGAQ